MYFCFVVVQFINHAAFLTTTVCLCYQIEVIMFRRENRLQYWLKWIAGIKVITNMKMRHNKFELLDNLVLRLLFMEMVTGQKTDFAANYLTMLPLSCSSFNCRVKVIV